MEIYKVPLSDFVDTSVNVLVKHLKKLQQEKDKITIALSGGSTPIPILKKLSKENLDWYKFYFFIVDERNVPIDSEQSNYGAIQKVFFNFIPSKNYSIISENNLEKSIKTYADLIAQHVQLENNIPAFDLMLLGMGNDGHIASLFPNSKALTVENEFVVQNYISKLDTNRITLTYPVIENSKNIVMMVKGSEKLKISEELFSNEQTNYPAQRIVDCKTNITWILGI